MARLLYFSCTSGRRDSAFLGAVTKYVILCSVTWLACVGSAAYAITREIFDCGDPNGDTACYLNYFSATYGYYFGRSEGQPTRGPNPLGPPYTGSTDVDILYNLAPVINQYYLTKFGRNGPNTFGGTGNGSTVPYHVFRVLANADGSTNGAVFCAGGNGGGFATTTSVAICSGSGEDLDVVGHEASHIFVRYLRQNPDTSWVRLAGPGEPGTLNEGMADFFGEAFERYVTGSNDWLATSGPNNYVVRDMANPPNVPQIVNLNPSPDRYLSPDFYTGTADNGGVHFNAGVLNKASYLAVEGGSFNGFNIIGIGFDKAEQIWYRALTMYFELDETFNEAYDDLVQAATDLYPAADVWEVTKALRSVEMHLSRAGLRGDFNGDGAVDAADYIVARKGLGSYYTLGAIEDWRIHFGATLDGNGGANDFTVPEPAAASIAFVAICCTVLMNGRSRQM